MENLIKTINALSESFAKDAETQAKRGTKAAGLRARKTALELIAAFKEFRKLSNEASKS